MIEQQGRTHLECYRWMHTMLYLLSWLLLPSWWWKINHNPVPKQYRPYLVISVETVIRGSNALCNMNQSIIWEVITGIRTTHSPTVITQVGGIIQTLDGEVIRTVGRDNKFKPRHHQDSKLKLNLGCSKLPRRSYLWRRCSCSFCKPNSNRCITSKLQ